MKKLFAYGVLFASLLAFSGCEWFKSEKSSLVEVGQESAANDLLAKSKYVVFDVYAPLCGTCKVLIPILNELSKKYEAVKFYKVNVNNLQKWSNNYGVKGVPTLIFFKEGKMLFSSFGPKTKEAVESDVKKLLAS